MEQLVYNFSMHHLPAKQLEKAQVNFCFLLKGQILAMSNFTTFKYFKFDLHRNKKKLSIQQNLHHFIQFIWRYNN